EWCGKSGGNDQGHRLSLATVRSQWSVQPRVGEHPRQSLAQARTVVGETPRAERVCHSIRIAAAPGQQRCHHLSRQWAKADQASPDRWLEQPADAAALRSYSGRYLPRVRCGVTSASVYPTSPWARRAARTSRSNRPLAKRPITCLITPRGSWTAGA